MSDVDEVLDGSAGSDEETEDQPFQDDQLIQSRSKVPGKERGGMKKLVV